MRPLSFSSISLYEDCPRKWHFKYIEKIPEKPRHFFSFGKTVHNALEFLYSVKTLPPPPLEEVLGHYREHWIAEGYESPKQESEYKAQGESILREYYAKNIGEFRIPYFTEYGFNMTVDGVKVVGFVDRIDKTESGGLRIVDYKTGKAIPKSRARTDEQLTMYQMACEDLLGLPVESLVFYHLPSQTPIASEPHDQGQKDGLREKIVATAGHIQAGRFEAKPEERKCGWCDYKPMCPAWKHLYAAASPAAEPEPPAITDDDKLAKLVDRYGKMREDIREREEKAEELKDKIVASLREKGYVRAFGAQYSATVHDEERWDFPDKRKVLDEIMRGGFWDRILLPSAPAVQKLMKDPSLPLALRDALQRLGKKVSQTTLRVRRTDEEE